MKVLIVIIMSVINIVKIYYHHYQDMNQNITDRWNMKNNIKMLIIVFIYRQLFSSRINKPQPGYFQNIHINNKDYNCSSFYELRSDIPSLYR